MPKPIRVPHTGTTRTDTTSDSSGIGTSVVRVETGATVWDAIQAEVITEPGIVPFSFYSLTNAAGQMLVPGAAAAISLTLPFRGSVIGLTFNASTACSGTYSVYLGGVATDVELIESAATADYQSWPKGTYGFAAGTTLDVRASSVTTSAAVLCTAYVIVDPSQVS